MLLIRAFLLLAQHQQAPAEDPSGISTWIAPGSATAAVIFVVVIFLRQQRYMQQRHEKSLKSFEEKLTAVTQSFEDKVVRITDQMQVNEERRMQQIQGLFDKMMLVSTETVRAITELRHGFESLSAQVKERMGDKPK